VEEEVRKHNFLIENKKMRDDNCSAGYPDPKKHVWILTGVIKALPGLNYSADFRCERCNKIYAEIFEKEQFDTILKYAKGSEDDSSL
jgi:hypothetical protein